MSTTTRGSSSGSGSSSSSSSSSSDGDIKRPVARLPSPAPALPPSTSALGDDTSSPSAAATAALTTLTDCMRSIVVGDLKYAQCVMDTGLFALSAPQPPALTQQLRNTSTPEAMLLAYVRTQLPSSTARDTKFGMCHLQCTAPSFRASRSCCDATRRLRACRLTAPTPALTTCKRSLDASLAYSNQECAVLTREDTALVTVTTLASVAAMAAGSLVVYRRRHAQRKLQRSSSSTPTESDSLDVAKSPSSSSPSLHDHALAKWVRQVAVLVWKNLVLRVRRPVALLFEQLVPLLFVSALVVLANLDSLFGRDADSVYRSGRHAASLNSTLFCVQLASLSASDLGAPSGTMRSFYSSGQSVVGLFFLLSFIKLVSSTTAAMVLEKELKMREMLKIMGVTNSALLASWVATSTILSLPVVFVLAALLKFGNVFPTTPYATVVFVFWSLTLAIVAFAYSLTPFFHKARTAAIVSVLLWLLLFFPFFDVQPKTTGAKFGGALAPPTAFALAIDRLLREAQLGTGFAYSMTKAATTSAFAGVPSAEAMSLFLLLDACLLLLLGWYFEQVVPQPYGVRKPWYFPFQFNYWQPPQAKFKLTLSSSPNIVPSPSFYALGSPDGDCNNAADSPIHHFSGGATPGTALLQIPIAEERRSSSIATLVEPVSAELAVQEHTGASLQLRALTKTFKLVDGEEKTAVDELSLTFYSGQITSLLGHNGAGKTTTISMLTGLYPPTSGDALLFGRSLQTESDAFRQIMGVCPQHDVLFPELSVDEHLEFFAVIKGIRGREAIAQSVDTLVHDVGLVGARRVLAKNLSGGQKRKLSVALALTGDTKLVFFDEPTSGMDPYSRRFTWNLLRRQRAGRVIVLTTHFMDEADVLGDRIAILADGKLKCVGSSLFLKTRFGAGYNLTIIKRSNGDGIPFVVEKVHRLVESFLGDGESQLASDSASEVVFTLSTRSSSQFPRLFDALDRDMALLGICNYGISVTTLEDVFLSIANDRGDHDDDDVPAAPKASPPSVMRSLTSTPPFRDQVQTQLLKRWWISKRDKKSLLNAMAIPLLFLLVLVLLPEIQVASFLPDYATSFATQAQQDACPPAQIKENLLSRATMDRCMGTGFGFCSLGLIDCDAAVCCDATRPQSPFYACSTCPIPATKVVATEPCFSSKCMTRSGAKLQVALNGFIVAMLVMLAFAFLPAAVIAFVVKEKDPTQDAKSLQWISGMALPAYWTANFVHDMVVVSWTVVAALVIVPLSRRALSGPQEVGALVLLVVAHALAIVPMTYLYSRRFTKHANAQTSMLVFSLASGGLLSIFSFLCRVVDFSMTSSLTLSGLDRDYLRWLFLLFPGYALNSGIYEIATRKITRGSLFGGRNADPRASLFGLFKGFGQDPRCVACWNRNTPGCCVRGTLAFDVALAPALVMLLEAVAFSALVFYLEKRATQGPAKKTEEDEDEDEEDQDPGKRETMLQVLPVTSDVIVEQEEDEAEYDEASEGEEGEDDDVVAERRRIDAMPDGGTIDDVIVIRRLHHEYADGRVALQKLSLAIPRGECFGYLGVNGAGKSTTIKVLTRQIVPTSGDVHVAGKNFLNHGRSDADDEDDDHDAADTGPSVIGYCPQFDALHDLLTVEEELTLYARIKGISLGRVPLEVDDKMHALGLTEYRHKLTRGLSGGNKRKVSTAIALLGSPPIVILDEPSTGMDPSARRKMWNVIASSCAVHRTSVVLTTHSMEECEALCSRVGILVQGRLQCLGSVQHLRHKFGRGFTVDIKLDSEPTKLQVASLRGRAHEILEDHPTEITEEQVAKLCEALGDASRMERIEKAAQGNAEWWSRGAGGVRTMELDQFAAWWLAQDRHDALASFFPQRFPGTTLVEQHGDHVRFHIPKHARESAVGRHDRASEFELRPKAIFQALEIGKQTLWIQEYSVSDTSLEHIFNRMADDGVNDADRLRPTMEADGQRSSRSSRNSHREGSSSMSQYAQGATTGL